MAQPNLPPPPTPLEGPAMKTTTEGNPDPGREQIQTCSKILNFSGKADDVQVSASHEENGLARVASAGKSAEQHVPGLKLLAIIASLTLVVFLMFLDTSIISTAIPQITDEFHSLQDVGWYASAYLLSSASLQPLTGKIYQKFSTKWSFLGFLGIFELGSLLCGVARSSMVLIIGRAVAGMGASGIINGGMTILVACAPLHRRPVLIGIIMGISQIGVICGPLLGGALTEYTTWRWCFYLNLPVGGLAMVYLAFLHIPDHTEKQPALVLIRSIYRDLDLVGFSLLASASIQLLLALQYGGGQVSWDSSTVIGLICGAGATALVWFVWDWYLGDAALIPLTILKKRSVWAAAVTQMGLSTALLGASYYLPMYFQVVKDTSAFASGVYTIPNIMGQILTAILAGFLVQRTGYIIPYCLTATALTATGTGLFALLTPTTSTGEWVGMQLLAGAGRGLGTQMGMLAVQTSLDQADISIGISLLMFAQLIGSAILMVVANTVFDQSLKSQLVINVPNVNGDLIIAAGATGFRSIINPEDLPGVLLSYTNSINHTFYVPAAVASVSFISANFLGWVDLRKKRKPA